LSIQQLHQYLIPQQFEGVVNNINRRYHESPSEFTREMMSRYMTELPCETCHGQRLSKEALSVYVAGLNIGEVVEIDVVNYTFKYHFSFSLSAAESLIKCKFNFLIS
jgi:excinuclease ABC subunit A